MWLFCFRLHCWLLFRKINDEHSAHAAFCTVLTHCLSDCYSRIFAIILSTSKLLLALVWVLHIHFGGFESWRLNMQKHCHSSKYIPAGLTSTFCKHCGFFCFIVQIISVPIFVALSVVFIWAFGLPCWVSTQVSRMYEVLGMAHSWIYHCSFLSLVFHTTHSARCAYKLVIIVLAASKLKECYVCKIMECFVCKIVPSWTDSCHSLLMITVHWLPCANLSVDRPIPILQVYAFGTDASFCFACVWLMRISETLYHCL